MPLQQSFQQRSQQSFPGQVQSQQGFQQEQPIYELRQSKKRAIIPKIIILIFLSALFYFGILLNISLLELAEKEETMTKLISIGILIFLFFLGILLAIRRAKFTYRFYHNRLTFIKKEVYYAQITNTIGKRNLFDKMFKTYSLPLNKKFAIKHISQQEQQQEQMQNYLQQLINYVKTQQQNTSF